MNNKSRLTVECKRIMRIQTLLIFFTVVFLSLPRLYVYAQSQDVTSEGVAIDIEILDKGAVDGSIVSFSGGKYTLSKIPYETNIFGVVTDHPAVVFKETSSTTKKSVVSFGKVQVRVSSINGNIKTGDLVTSSTIPGVGQKATENGYVIGSALQDYESNDTKKIGLIYVTLHPQFGSISQDIRENILSSIKNGGRAAFTSPLNALRYIVAGLIAILSFAGGFWFFGRISSHGVEAIGRNPLARRFILLSVGLNVLLTIAVMGLGVALAYMILVI